HRERRLEAGPEPQALAEPVSEREVGAERGAAPAEEADRYAEPLALGPERVEVAIVPRLPQRAPPRQENPPEPVLGHRAARLRDRARDVVRRDHRAPVEPLRIRLHEVVEPVVV